MHQFYDPDEWEVVTESHPCTACGGDLSKCNGMCNGSAYVGQRRRAPEDVARIKAEKQRADEDAILAEADAIRRRRAAQP